MAHWLARYWPRCEGADGGMDSLLPRRRGQYRRYEPINVGRDELGERLAHGVERLREREVAPRVPGVFVERLCECKFEGEAVSLGDT